jgi:DNA-directed RNA polymerase specialized sigma24 family protein
MKKTLEISKELLAEINMSEAEVLDLINKIARSLAFKFTFPGYSVEDIVQEATMLGIMGLRKYRPSQPLENFLRVHMKNRLCNFKRDNYMRRDLPCQSCPIGAWIKPDRCGAYKNRSDCKLFAEWELKNENKKNIINPISMSAIVEDDENSVRAENCIAARLDNKDLIKKIDAEIPASVRALWLQAKIGVKITAEEMRQLRIVIMGIING